MRLLLNLSATAAVSLSLLAMTSGTAMAQVPPGLPGGGTITSGSGLPDGSPPSYNCGDKNCPVGSYCAYGAGGVGWPGPPNGSPVPPGAPSRCFEGTEPPPCSRYANSAQPCPQGTHQSDVCMNSGDPTAPLNSICTK